MGTPGRGSRKQNYHVYSLFRSFSSTHLPHRFRKILDLFLPSFLLLADDARAFIRAWCMSVPSAGTLIPGIYKWFTAQLKNMRRNKLQSILSDHAPHEALKILIGIIYDCIIKSLVL